MPATTRQRLIDAAVSRFYRDGFRNVGVDQILNDVGISKTAFYKHFQSKDDLMLAALHSQDRWLQNFLRQQLKAAAGDGAREQLHALFGVVKMIVDNVGFNGCIFVNAAMEFPLPHDPVHEAAAANKRAIEQLVLELAERAGAEDPKTMSRELCLLMEGAYVTRQVSGTSDAAELAGKLANRILTERLPPAERPLKTRAIKPKPNRRTPTTLL